jgi:hypothetical protein
MGALVRIHDLKIEPVPGETTGRPKRVLNREREAAPGERVASVMASRMTFFAPSGQSPPLFKII